MRPPLCSCDVRLEVPSTSRGAEKEVEEVEEVMGVRMTGPQESCFNFSSVNLEHSPELTSTAGQEECVVPAVCVLLL